VKLALKAEYAAWQQAAFFYAENRGSSLLEIITSGVSA